MQTVHFLVITTGGKLSKVCCGGILHEGRPNVSKYSTQNPNHVNGSPIFINQPMLTTLALILIIAEVQNYIQNS